MKLKWVAETLFVAFCIFGVFMIINHKNKSEDALKAKKAFKKSQNEYESYINYRNDLCASYGIRPEVVEFHIDYYQNRVGWQWCDTRNPVGYLAFTLASEKKLPPKP